MQYVKIKHGYYKPKKCPVKIVRFDSGWEEEYMQLLDEDDTVKKWFKNGSGLKPIKIQYQYHGEPHEYIPDFVVFNQNGNIEIREVKAFIRSGDSKEFADMKAEAKIKAIKEKCMELGYEFKLVRKFR